MMRRGFVIILMLVSLPFLWSCKGAELKGRDADEAIQEESLNKKREVRTHISDMPEIYTGGSDPKEETTNFIVIWDRITRPDKELEKSKEIYQNVFPAYRDMLTIFLSGNGEENALFSPVLTYEALAMLAYSAEGETQQEILNALYAESSEQVRENAEYIWQFANYQVDDGENIHFSSLFGNAVLADAYYFQNDIEKLESFCEEFHASTFVGSIRSEEMKTCIEEWVETQLYEEYEFPFTEEEGTVWELLSILHYEAPWYSPIISQLVVDSEFAGSKGVQKCQMMVSSERGFAYDGDCFVAGTKYLQDFAVVLFVLPDEGMDPTDVLQSNDLMNLLKDRESYEKQMKATINLEVPVLDLGESYCLNEGLHQMGIQKVFTDEAELPGLSAGASSHASKMEQQINFNMNEDGISMTATNGTTGFTKGGESVHIVCDRPFFLFIQLPDGSILLGGLVNHM